MRFSAASRARKRTTLPRPDCWRKSEQGTVYLSPTFDHKPEPRRRTSPCDTKERSFAQVPAQATITRKIPERVELYSNLDIFAQSAMTLLLSTSAIGPGGRRSDPKTQSRPFSRFNPHPIQSLLFPTLALQVISQYWRHLCPKLTPRFLGTPGERKVKMNRHGRVPDPYPDAHPTVQTFTRTVTSRYERCRARLETSQEHLADLNERFNELRAEVEVRSFSGWDGLMWPSVRKAVVCCDTCVYNDLRSAQFAPPGSCTSENRGSCAEKIHDCLNIKAWFLGFRAGVRKSREDGADEAAYPPISRYPWRSAIYACPRVGFSANNQQ